jgi:hypothetical protein
MKVRLLTAAALVVAATAGATLASVATATGAPSSGSATASSRPAPPPPRNHRGPAAPGGTATSTGATNPNAPGGNASSAAASQSSTTTVDGVTVTISGGHATDARDGGRPVALIAAALGVPTDVFRTAFSGVTPAGPGSGGPSAEDARANKAALLRVLAPYGITNEKLDQVSNYYRYMGSNGELWHNTLATAEAVVVDGRVTGITITNPGAGYTTAPKVTITGAAEPVTATATIRYTTDFATNGSITAITLG